jgi:hypothetical protein
MDSSSSEKNKLAVS